MKLLIPKETIENYSSRDSIPLECYYCQSTFYLSKNQVMRGLKGTRSNKFCSHACSSASRSQSGTTVVSCTNCSKQFKKKNSQIIKTQNHFCSQSCSATFNNKVFPKRKLAPHNKCENCGRKSRGTKSVLCRECLKIKTAYEFGKTKTIGDFTSTNARHKHQHVRKHAHRIAKIHSLPKICKVCNYSHHVELCHIQPIHSFPLETTLSVVNSLSNLVFLCPNHHWELENGLIKI